MAASIIDSPMTSSRNSVPSPTSCWGSGKTCVDALLGQDRAARGDPARRPGPSPARRERVDRCRCRHGWRRPAAGRSRAAAPRRRAAGWGRGAGSPCPRARAAGGPPTTCWSARPSDRSRACSAGYPRACTESRITASTRRCRGVSPVASGGPSGSSWTSVLCSALAMVSHLHCAARVGDDADREPGRADSRHPRR